MSEPRLTPPKIVAADIASIRKQAVADFAARVRARVAEVYTTPIGDVTGPDNDPFAVYLHGQGRAIAAVLAILDEEAAREARG